MPAPCLPIEVSELIIDACASRHCINSVSGDWSEDGGTSLLACALTCKAWLPRSLFHLYRGVTLYGDDRTRSMVEKLKKTPHLVCLITTLRHIIPSDNNSHQDTCHLVPRYLAKLSQTPLNLQVVEILSAASSPRPQLGSTTHDTFLRSYSIFRSVETLRLGGITFESFSYFARLVLCFPRLRHLTLHLVDFQKLNNYPPRIARGKQLQLRTLVIDRIRKSCLYCFAWWLLKSHVLSSMQSLIVTSDDSSPIFDATDPILLSMLCSMGRSLIHSCLRLGGIAALLCYQESTQTITIVHTHSVTAVAILSSAIPSRSFVALNLDRILVHDIADLNNLIDFLTSSRLSSIERVGLQVAPSPAWITLHDKGYIGDQKNIRNAVVEEVEYEFRKLRDVFGETVHAEVDCAHWLTWECCRCPACRRYSNRASREHWRQRLNNLLQISYGVSALNWEDQQHSSEGTHRYWESVAFIRGIEYGRGTGHRVGDAHEAAAQVVYRQLFDHLCPGC